MKYILTADNHLSQSYPFSTSTDPFKDLFFKSSIKAFNQIVNRAIEEDCHIINGGDFFDNEFVRAPDLHAAMLVMRKLGQHKRSMVLNIGNHEIGWSGIPSVSETITGFFPRVYTPSINVDWAEFMLRGLHIYTVPYSKEPIFNDVLAKLLKSDIKQPACLCIHQNIKGIQMGKTMSKDGLTTEQICTFAKKKFKFIIVGHIHHSHYSTKFGIPLIIPGSTIAMDFKDEGSEKSFCLLHLDKDYNVKKLERVPIKDQIRFVTKVMDEIDNDFISSCKNHFIQVHVDIQKHDDFYGLQEKLIAAGAIGVKPVWGKPNTDDGLVSYQRPIKMSTEDWLVKYMQKKHYHDSEIEIAKDFHQEIFKE